MILFPFSVINGTRKTSPLLMTLNLGYDMVIASQTTGRAAAAAPGTAIAADWAIGFSISRAGVLMDSNLSDSFSTFRGIRRSRLGDVRLQGKSPELVSFRCHWKPPSGLAGARNSTVEVPRSTRGLIANSLATGDIPALLVLLKEWRSRDGSPS